MDGILHVSELLIVELALKGFCGLSDVQCKAVCFIAMMIIIIIFSIMKNIPVYRFVLFGVIFDSQFFA
jgi:hypothetical protein